MPHDWKKLHKISKRDSLWSCTICGCIQTSTNKPYDKLGIHYKRLYLWSISGPNYNTNFDSLYPNSAAEMYLTCEQLTVAQVQSE
jgi:hypothetical protein